MDFSLGIMEAQEVDQEKKRTKIINIRNEDITVVPWTLKGFNLKTKTPLTVLYHQFNNLDGNIVTF